MLEYGRFLLPGMMASVMACVIRAQDSGLPLCLYRRSFCERSHCRCRAIGTLLSKQEQEQEQARAQSAKRVRKARCVVTCALPASISVLIAAPSRFTTLSNIAFEITLTFLRRGLEYSTGSGIVAAISVTLGRSVRRNSQDTRARRLQAWQLRRPHVHLHLELG
jgi:hypothetical protein